MVLPGGVDSSELTPAIASHMPYGETCFHTCDCFCGCDFTQGTLLNLQSIKCLMLRIKLAIAFSLPHGLAHSSRFTPPARVASRALLLNFVKVFLCMAYTLKFMNYTAIG